MAQSRSRSRSQAGVSGRDVVGKMRMSAECAAAAKEMQRLLASFWLTRAIHVAARLGLADLLSEPRSAAELASLTHTHAPSLRRVLRFLASAGIFREEMDGRFALTPVAATLRVGVPGSLHAWALIVGEECLPASRALLHSVKTGDTGFDHLNSQTVWECRATRPDRGQLFDEAMANGLQRLNADIVELVDASGIQSVVDVGGGDGSLLTALLHANPHLSGIVFDLPHVVERARQRIAQNALAKRCAAVAGSALDFIPADADVYILSRVLHNGDDARSLRILRNCCRAGKKTSRLLVIERIAPTHVECSHEAQDALSADLNMLTMNGGCERTEAEYRALLCEAGFTMIRITPTRSYFQLIEAVTRS